MNRAALKVTGLTIRNVLIYLFLVVSILPIGILSMVFYQSLIPDLEARLIDSQRSLATAVSRQADSYFRSAEREIGALSRLLAEYGNDEAQIRVILQSYAAASDFYETLYVTDRRLRISAIAMPESTMGMTSNVMGLDVSAQDFIQSALETGEITWSDIYLSPVTARPTVSLALAREGRIISGDVALFPFPELVSTLGREWGLRIILTDSLYQTVADSMDLIEGQLRNLGNLQLLRNAGQAGNLFELDGQRYIGSSVSLEGLGWIVLVAQDEEDAFLPVRVTWGRVSISILAALVLSLALGVLMASLLSARIREFAEFATKISAGNYHLPWKNTRIQELQTLKNSMQAMSLAIGQREDALSRLNQELEGRVAQRTAELSAANSELESALSSLKNAQERLVRSEKMSGLTVMMSGIAHELNTPLGNSITANSTVTNLLNRLRMDIYSGELKKSSFEKALEDLTQAAELIQSNLVRAGDLISGFREISIDHQGEVLTRFDLCTKIREVGNSVLDLLERRGILYSCTAPSTLEMHSYPGVLTQVLLALFNNSVQHAFPQDRVLSLESSPVISLKVAEDHGNHVEILFSDNGVGMDDGTLRRVFDPFFTTRFGQGNSGLGLSLAYNLVTGILGGEISVLSAPGKGFEIRLFLPLTL